MRKNFGANNWLYPMPVLIVGTYDENGVEYKTFNAKDGQGIANLKKAGIITVSPSCKVSV